MSDNVYVDQMIWTLEDAIFYLPCVPGACSGRWTRWTDRRIRRQLSAVLNAACALRLAIQKADEELGQPLHYITTVRRLLTTLLPAAALPEADDYLRYAQAWSAGLSTEETDVLRTFFGTTTGELPWHVTQWRFHPDDGAPLER